MLKGVGQAFPTRERYRVLDFRVSIGNWTVLQIMSVDLVVQLGLIQNNYSLQTVSRVAHLSLG